MGCFRLLTGLAALAALLGPGLAHAQWNNEPYQFRNSGGSLGMSPAYKQAMINRELFGSEPRNLVRGSDGQLLEVVRGRGHQAFLAEPQPNWVVSRSRVLDGGGGTGLFLSTGGVGVGVGAINGWTAMVGSDGIAPAAPQSYSPIDAWVAMLD